MQGRRTIMIVGNGEVPEGFGATIDAADIVVRFNDCRSVGPGGHRTDIVAVCNTGRPGISMLGGGRWKTNAAVRQAGEIWCVRSGAKFAAMRAGLAETHPDLDDFCDDYTIGFESFCRSTNRRFRVVPVDVHDQVQQDLAGFSPDPYVVPSSGMIVIADILAHLATPADDVVLAGFGHIGWLWHPFAAERRHVDALAGSGRLRRLHPVSFSPQGA